MTSPVPARSLRVLPAVAVAALAVAAVGCGNDAADAEIETVISVVDAGSTDQPITLPVPYAVGQSASIVGTFTTDFDADAAGVDESLSLSVRLGYTSTVTALDEDGGSTVESVFGSGEVLDASEGIDLDAVEDLVGVSYEEHYSVEGEVTDTEILGEDDLSDEQQAAARDFIGQSEAASIAYPAGPVGVGARWTESTSIDAQGVEVPVTYEYELVELTADTYTIELSYSSDIDAEVEGADITGNVGGSGTIVGDVANALAVTAYITQDMHMDLDGGTVDMAVIVDLHADGIDLPEGAGPVTSEPSATSATSSEPATTVA